MTEQPNEMAEAIREVCNELAEMLIAKNKSYGNSVGDPVAVFSKLDADTRMLVRMDDKLSRIARGVEYPGDDTELDLAGYLLLRRALKRVKERNEAEAHFGIQEGDLPPGHVRLDTVFGPKGFRHPLDVPVLKTECVAKSPVIKADEVNEMRGTE